MPNSSYLVIDGLSKIYGSTQALKPVNLHVKKGEFIALVGPSGCGKSTFLRLLAGLESVTTGRIVQNGSDITTQAVEARDFGIVFQNYALFPNLTALQNIAFGLKNNGWKKAAAIKQAYYWLERVNLVNVADKLPARLSGGQQQRVALARALALSPGLLLLDEPLSALDANVRCLLRRQILALQKELGITTIMVTHDQEEALTMADRVVVMNDGMIEQVGSPVEVYQCPINLFVANFIGEANFIDTTTRNNETPFNHAIEALDHHYAEKDSATGKLLLRPEHLNLCSESEAHFSADLTDRAFMGSTVRLRLSYNDQPLQVDVNAEDLDQLPDVGQLCHLRINTQRLQVF